MPRTKKSTSPIDKQIEVAKKKVTEAEKKLEEAKKKVTDLEAQKAMQADLERLGKVLVEQGVSVDDAIKLVQGK